MIRRLPALLAVLLLCLAGTAHPAAAAPAPPTTSSLSPATGGTLGGASVTVRGTGLTGETAVLFGPTAATAVSVSSDGTSLVATAPEGLAGPVPVTVTTPAGTSNGTPFTYTQDPYVSLGGSSYGSVSYSVTSSSGGSLLGGTSGTTVSSAPVPFGSVSFPASATKGGGTETLAVNDAGDVRSVTFGGTAATVTDRYDGYLDVTVPAHAAGTVVVAITTSTGTSKPQTGADPTDRFVYTDSPYIGAVLPQTGVEAGGDSISLVGINFTGVTGATVGGKAATRVAVQDDGDLTLTTPAGTGQVAVALTGSKSSVAQTGGLRTDLFRYRSPLAVTGLSPDYGTTAGGTTLDITGRGFTGATHVTVGGVDATISTISSGGDRITVTTPAHAAGDAAVSVVTPAGTSAAEGESSFTFVDPKAPGQVFFVDSTVGPTTGGSTVVIEGEGLVGATKVAFGDVAATSVYVTGDGLVYATLPPHAAGTVPVTVTTANGASTPQTGPQRSDTFTYVAAPRIDVISSRQGPTRGGDRLEVQGIHLDGAQVLFGGVPGTDVVGGSDTELEVTAPPHSAGAVQVTVTGPGGPSTTGGQAATTYSYTDANLDQLLVGGFSQLGGPAAGPTDGPSAGGTQTVIADDGRGFAGITAVTFGGVVTHAYTVTDDHTLTVTTPPHAAGTVAVSVTTAAGQTAAQTGAYRTDQFTYSDAPAVDDLSDSSGGTAGGATITLDGRRLTGTTAVLFGTVSVRPLSISTDGTSLAVRVPAHPAGPVTVTATNARGTSPSGPTYEYADLPAVDQLDLDRGPLAGGDTLTVTGERLTGATAVLFGTTKGTAVAVADDGGSLTVTIPAHAAGSVRITVVTPAGSSPADAFEQDTYLYANDPLVYGLDPAEGAAAGGMTVTLFGDGLGAATEVDFGRLPGLAVTPAADGRSLSVVTPPGTPGDAAVTVKTAAGSSVPGPTFRYDGAAPVVGVIDVPTGDQELADQAGDVAGGYVVRITGANLTTTTGVTFGGVAGTSVTPSTDGTSLTVVAPAHAAGVVTVVVTNPAGSATGPFTYVQGARVTAVGTPRGPATGGTRVTLTGSGLNASTAVALVGADGTTYDGTDVVYAPDGTSVSFTTPRVPAGSYTISVSTVTGHYVDPDLARLTTVAPGVFTALATFADSPPVARAVSSAHGGAPAGPPVSAGRTGAAGAHPVG